MPTSDDAALSCWDAGHECLAKGDAAGAVHAFREAVRIDPAFGEAYGDLGVALAEQEAWAESAAAHERAVELLPGQLEAAFNLGVSRFMLGDYTGAERSLREAVSAAPDSADAWYWLGLALAQQSKCGDALEAFQRVCQQTPDSARGYAMAARELVHFGRGAEAEAMLARVEALQPSLVEEWPELLELRERIHRGA